MIWLAAFMTYFAPPAILVWLPIFVGSKTEGGWIFTTFAAGTCVIVTCLVLQFRYGVTESCALNSSECLGATAFAYLITAYNALCFFVGGISTFFNLKKWHRAKLGAN